MVQMLKLVRWPVLVVLVALALAVVYQYALSRNAARWRWVSWGSAFATVAWLAASVLFSWYVANFGSYNKTYGSLGAVIGFMTWMWVSIIVVLVGAKLDAEINAGEHDRPNRIRLIRADRRAAAQVYAFPLVVTPKERVKKYDEMLSFRARGHCPRARNPYVDGPGHARAWQLRRVWSVAVICRAFVVRSTDRWPRWVARIGSQT